MNDVVCNVKCRPLNVDCSAAEAVVRLTGGSSAGLGRPSEEHFRLMRAINLVIKNDGSRVQNQAFAY